MYRNVWNPLEAVSFDRNGYLFVDQLSDDTALPALLAIQAIILPRDDRDALVLYAYDIVVSDYVILRISVLLLCLVLLFYYYYYYYYYCHHH